jgi:hypothetical protein
MSSETPATEPNISAVVRATSRAGGETGAGFGKTFRMRTAARWDARLRASRGGRNPGAGQPVSKMMP